MNPFRMFRRPWGVFYCEDRTTGKQTSLRTRERPEAMRLLHAKNEARQQPLMNLQMARTYLMASDPAAGTRTWQGALDLLLQAKRGPTRLRWMTAAKDPALAGVWSLRLLETRGDHFLEALHRGSVSTNVYLRRLHNFVLGMNWCPGPVLSKNQWPAVRFGEKRAVTADEHRRILAREKNPEWRRFLQLCWHLGASQSDLAGLQAENIDWEKRLLGYSRRKTGQTSLLSFGRECEAVLRQLPTTGPCFPWLGTRGESDRASAFLRRCRGLDIQGVSLHSYRYSWAERAKRCGYPERFAQQALGHNSKAVHRAYARNAIVEIPSLEDCEMQFAETRRRPPLASPPPENP